MPNLNFDDQAQAFDRRAGLSPADSTRVAAAVMELSGPGWLLDLGAGTGVVGCDLAHLHQRYLGLDLSLPMLAVFRGKQLGKPTGMGWVQADGDRPWPVADASVGTLFCSRAAHLLSFAHLIEEAQRVAHAKGMSFVLGSVRRSEDSVRDALRREMRRLLKEQGIEGGGGRQLKARILDELEGLGGQKLAPRNVSSWSVQECPMDALKSWRSKNGLAGRAVPEDIRNLVLNRLETWARERWGSLEKNYPSTEYYELRAIRLGA